MENKENNMNGTEKVALTKEEATFVQSNSELTDTKFETKQMSFFQDAFRRFAQNKGSVVAGVIILFLLTFSIITPFFSGYTATQADAYYSYCKPKNPMFAGTGFWDGTETEDVAIQKYVEFYESTQVISVKKKDADKTNIDSYYTVRHDTYKKGYAYKSFEESEFLSLQAYDATVEASARILNPLVDYANYIETTFDNPGTRTQLTASYTQKAYIAYKLAKNGQPIYVTDANGDAVINPQTGAVELQYIYTTDSTGNYVYYEKTGSEGAYSYSCRINYDNYYLRLHGKAPVFVLGSDNQGRDIMTRLALGGRLSLALGIIVSALNFIIGAIYGAIEGYYGGKIDLVMERISEILAEVPTTIIFVLFNWYLKDKVPVVLLLFLAFIFVGWLGTAATVRMQFYRFKNQEYVLAARTLGAKDSRLIIKHIFPNALGTVVTSSVLMIPGVIFTESSLSYLKIIDLSSSGITSIGTMLSDGQTSFTVYPNLIIWPALFISLLMICFNVFGNGLRDAFNPTLRGSEE